MLNKTSEMVLKQIIFKCDGKPEELTVISPVDFEDNSINIEVLLSVLKDLYANGYLNDHGFPCNEYDSIDVQLSYKGYTYFETKNIENINFWKQFALSKISDVVLCVVTTIITTLIISLF